MNRNHAQGANAVRWQAAACLFAAAFGCLAWLALAAPEIEFLLPYLRPGTNVLKTTVFGTNGPSALLVEGPPAPRNGTNWTVRFGNGRPTSAAVACAGERFMRTGDGVLWQDKNRRLFGFCLAVWRLLRTQRDDSLLAVVLIPLLTMTGVVAFTMEVPTYSAIKGFFLLSLIPAGGVFAGMGLATMARQLGRLLRWILYGWMGVLGAPGAPGNMALCLRQTSRDQ